MWTVCPLCQGGYTGHILSWLLHIRINSYNSIHLVVLSIFFLVQNDKQSVFEIAYNFCSLRKVVEAAGNGVSGT